MYTYIAILSFPVLSVRAEGTFKQEQNMAAFLGSRIMVVLFVNYSSEVHLKFVVHCVPLILVAIEAYCYSTKFSILI
jgi:hypothetical protein